MNNVKNIVHRNKSLNIKKMYMKENTANHKNEWFILLFGNLNDAVYIACVFIIIQMAIAPIKVPPLRA